METAPEILLRPVLPLRPPYRPELLAAVCERLEAWLASAYAGKCYRPKTALELGSGYSTPWLAQRVGNLCSFEHDPVWHGEVRRVLNELIRAENASTYPATVAIQPFLLTVEEFSTVTENYPNRSFDLVVVDCRDEVRVSCAVAALPKLVPGGLLLLDDTHWELWGPFLSLMDSLGWAKEVYEGEHVRHSGEVKYHHTTLYTKPAS